MCKGRACDDVKGEAGEEGRVSEIDEIVDVKVDLKKRWIEDDTVIKFGFVAKKLNCSHTSMQDPEIN